MLSFTLVLTFEDQHRRHRPGLSEQMPKKYSKKLSMKNKREWVVTFTQQTCSE